MKIARLAVLALAAAPFVAVIACGDSATNEESASPSPTTTATGTGTGTTPTPTGTTTAVPDAGPARDAADGSLPDTSVATHTVRGTVVNAVNAGLVLQNNGADDVVVAAGGTTFQFTVPVASGSAYAVTIKTAPSEQACKVTAGAGTVGNADVTNVVIDCSNRTSCRALKTEMAALASGTYLIDPDGAAAIVPFAAYCDMTYDDGTGAGGWTLIQSLAGKNGPAAAVEGAVAPGTSSYLALANMVALATLGTQVHIRSTGLAVTQSVTSKANMEPIMNLRLGVISNEGLVGLTPTEQTDRWTGPFAVADRLAFGCTPGNAPWPNVYHACDNQIGLHITTGHARWNWQAGDTTQNLDMEVYVR